MCILLKISKRHLPCSHSDSKISRGGGKQEKQVSQGCFHDESQSLIIPFNWSSAITIPESSETLYNSCQEMLPNKGFTNSDYQPPSASCSQDATARTFLGKWLYMIILPEANKLGWNTCGNVWKGTPYFLKITKQNHHRPITKNQTLTKQKLAWSVYSMQVELKTNCSCLKPKVLIWG